ncbi:MAG: hypothetical protein ACT4P6_08615 [Gemmatimonadaceae bacterium]
MPRRARDTTLTTAKGARSEKWTDVYLVKQRGGLHVDLDADGVRHDIAFWRWPNYNDWTPLLTLFRTPDRRRCTVRSD